MVGSIGKRAGIWLLQRMNADIDGGERRDMHWAWDERQQVTRRDRAESQEYNVGLILTLPMGTEASKL